MSFRKLVVLLAAVKGGKSIQILLWEFTPLAGIMMGTRAGSIDPSVISFLIERKRIYNRTN